MQINKLLFFIAVFIFAVEVSAQVSGVVFDEKGETLPFVTIYKDGTSNGTVSNVDGEYTLNLQDGQHTLVYRYIGYGEIREKVNVNGPTDFNVVLVEEAISLNEVVIAADAEDPAYRVIRAAIKARDENKFQAKKYAADLYVKGVMKVKKAPEKILGIEVGDMDGMLDTSGQGIVYLAESQSHIYYHEPDLLKEEMYSSIVAEDDGTFNFNQFQGSYFSIYDEHFNFSRSFISPLADNALLYYRYKMLGTYIDSRGNLINKIQVIPKSDVRPTLFGTLYIIDESWKVSELDLSMTGKALKTPFFDTVMIQQVHLPVENDNYMLMSQTMRFSSSVFGFKFGGGFTYVFSDYNLNPDFDESFFGSERFKMDRDAVKTDSSFWTEVRPVKLTQEERDNYIKKDSLKKVWNSKWYMDSLDRVNNKLKPVDLLFGYTHSNTYKKRFISYDSPLSTYYFNPVEGHSLKMGLGYSQLDSSEQKRFAIGAKIGYGFADQRVKYAGQLTYTTNRFNMERYRLKVGDENVQFFHRDPVPQFIDTWMNLMYKDNLGKFYRKKYLTAEYRRELYNGILMFAHVGYADRSPLELNSDYSFRNKTKLYESNHPLGNPYPSLSILPSTNFTISLAMRFKIGQQFATFPKFRLRRDSKWPDLWLTYRKAISALGDASYDKVTLRISKDRIPNGLFGMSTFYLTAGKFLNKDNVYFMDQFHFQANRTIVTLKDRYKDGFKMMPYYTYSGTNDYVSAFFNHNFDGFIFDLIPGVKQLGWSTSIGANALVRKDGSNYYELSAGITDVKIKGFSLFRFDYVWSFDGKSLYDHGIVIGLSGLFSN